MESQVFCGLLDSHCNVVLVDLTVPIVVNWSDTKAWWTQRALNIVPDWLETTVLILTNLGCIGGINETQLGKELTIEGDLWLLDMDRNFLPKVYKLL